MTSTTPKAAKARKTPAEGAPALTIVAPAEPVVAGPVLKKKDLIERAAERSDLKRGEARKGVEAALDVLAEALLSGAELVVPPLGKIKVVKVKEAANARILTVKIRVPNESGGGKDPLAEAQD
jgi:DNA-binding protein HU-alpha